jgi:hypothetical protein
MSFSCRQLFFSILLVAIAVCFGQVHITSPTGRNIEVEEHTEIRLVCRVPADTKTVTWYHEDRPISGGEDGVSLKPINSTEFELKIEEAEPEHGGQYRCHGGNQQSAETVTVRVIGSLISLTVTPTSLALSDGEDLTLTCTADIHSHICWHFEGQPLTTGGEYQINETTDAAKHLKTLTLVRRRVTVSASGTYTCRETHHAHHKGDAHHEHQEHGTGDAHHEHHEDGTTDTHHEDRTAQAVVIIRRNDQSIRPMSDGCRQLAHRSTLLMAFVSSLVLIAIACI